LTVTNIYVSQSYYTVDHSRNALHLAITEAEMLGEIYDGIVHSLKNDDGLEMIAVLGTD